MLPFELIEDDGSTDIHGTVDVFPTVATRRYSPEPAPQFLLVRVIRSAGCSPAKFELQNSLEKGGNSRGRVEFVFSR